MSDKAKIALLWIAIILIIGIIIVVGYLTYLNIVDENNPGNISNTTTTRRTVKTTKKTTNTYSTKELTSEVITTTEIITTTTRNNSSSGSNNNRTTTTASTGGGSSSGGSSTSTPTTTYETTTSSTTYQNAIDAYEWALVNRINQARRNNGLQELEVAVRFRQLAEEFADRVENNSCSVVSLDNAKTYINYAGGDFYNTVNAWVRGGGFSESQMLSMNDEFYDYIISTSSVLVITSADIRYIGVGVIKKQVGSCGLYVTTLVFT